MTTTEKCKDCEYHDPNWREYSQLVTCAHPKVLGEHNQPIWCLYPRTDTFCRKYEEFTPIN